tara:strand:+ start:66 stop:629 length:564 start_codon:yes stop_codon:yes gene_type:complete
MSEIHTTYDWWYWPKVFSHGDLLELHDIFNKHSNEQAKDTPAKNVTKKINLQFTNWQYLKDKLYFLEQEFLKVNRERFGCDIWPKYNNDVILLNEYNETDKGEYDWHIDSSNNHICDLKFTMLINTSLNPYEGGEFKIFNGVETNIKELDNPGDVVVFKSFKYHKVTPVTKGKRHSLSIFYYGPRYR